VDARADAVPAGGRDWAADPAIAQLPAADPLYAVSDVHGGYARAVTLLAGSGLIAASPAAPSSVRWTGGAATLVVVGDEFDKGPQGVEVVDFFRALATSASAAGGTVVVLLGNHEAEFLADPLNSKATATDGIDPEITSMGGTPVMYASDSDPRGHWLRTRPFGARVGRWFFAHAGDTHGRTIAALEAALETAIDTNGWSDAEVIGTSSILESRNWYASDPTLAARYATALGAGHIVFGHDPSALGPRGAIAVANAGALFRIDTGMSPDVNDSHGWLLRVRHSGANDVAEAVDPSGTVRSLWTGP
jgi:hypothetical protein